MNNLEQDLVILKLLKKWLCKRTDGILGFKTYVTLDNIEYIDDYLKIESWLENKTAEEIIIKKGD